MKNKERMKVLAGLLKEDDSINKNNLNTQKEHDDSQQSLDDSEISNLKILIGKTISSIDSKMIKNSDTDIQIHFSDGGVLNITKSSYDAMTFYFNGKEILSKS